MLDTLLKLDGDILLWIQDNLRAGWLDPIMKFITYCKRRCVMDRHMRFTSHTEKD